MLREYIAAWRASQRFSGYRPKPVTFRGALRWLDQFNAVERQALIRFMQHVIYIDEHETVRLLKEANKILIRRLREAGIPPENIIYLQFDEAASSSPVTLNLLRDSARLIAMGATLLDSNDILKLRQKTSELERGAIIYVDDFVGSGTQFEGTQQFVSDYIQGNFSEFLLASCICEEAFENLKYSSLELIACIKHPKCDRPLLAECDKLCAEDKATLLALCRRLDPIDQVGLGFDSMATMFVSYMNSPDNCSLALRGSVGQNPTRGLLPRTTDFPYNAGE
jgi:hypothetical protein